MLQANTLELEKRAGELATHARQLCRIEEELEEFLQDIKQQGGEMLLPALKKSRERLYEKEQQLQELINRLYEIWQILENCEERITEEYLQERLHHRHAPSVIIQILPDTIRNNLTTTSVIGIKF